jgi:hypothetical protein
MTLFDVMRQMAIERQELKLPVKPSFKRDIWPMLRRASGLRWVNSQPHWRKFSTDWARLSNPAASEKPLRADNAKLLRQVGDQEKLRNFHLRPWQKTYLQAWEDGNFSNDFDGNLPDAGVLSPDVLTRTVLDGGVARILPRNRGGYHYHEQKYLRRAVSYRDPSHSRRSHGTHGASLAGGLSGVCRKLVA